jgi:hypothetical protein
MTKIKCVLIQVDQCPVIQDVSLPHSKIITQVAAIHSSSNGNCTSPVIHGKQTSLTKKKKTDICLLESTNTDWIKKVALIRKNHNIVDKRRPKNLKRL